MNARAVATALFAITGCERADLIEPTAPIELPSETSPTIAQQPHVARPVPPTVEDVARHTLAMRRRAARTVSKNMRWFFGLSAELRDDMGEICREWKRDPCDGMIPRAEGVPQPVAELLKAKLTVEQREGIHGYCQESSGPRGRCDTPLVVAFDAQPIAFTAATGASFAFAPGVPVATDWPTAVTPWIALDRDGDGAITSGAELFGDSTVLPGGTTARNGFEALAALDANHDGVIDRADPAFAKLLLWADRNADRTSSPDELRPLSSVVIAIPLANHVDVRCTERGACEGERGLVQWRDPSGVARTGAVIDVYLPDSVRPSTLK